MARHKVGIDKITALFVVSGLQLDPGVVIRQDVGEPVLGPVDRDVRRGARFVPPHVLELLVLLGEAEVGVCGHDAVVLGKVLELHGPGRFDHGLRDGLVVAVTHVAGGATFQTVRGAVSHPGNIKEFCFVCFVVSSLAPGTRIGLSAGFHQVPP